MARKPEPAGGGVNAPPPDGEEAMILSGIAKMDELEEKAVNARKAVSRFRKEFSATTGVKLKIFDMVRAERGLERKENVGDQAALFRLRRFLMLPVATQAELFPADVAPQTEDAAYLDGFTKGVAGKGKRQPPEQFATGKQAQRWMEGWDEGQAKLGANFFGKKDYSKDPADKPAKAAGPSGKERVDPKAEKAKKEADNVVALKPPGVPDKAANKPKPKPETPALDAVVKKVAAEKKKPATKAEEAAQNGGVGGLAPPGARKGGGDFDDDGNLFEQEEDDVDLDDDFDLEEDEDEGVDA